MENWAHEICCYSREWGFMAPKCEIVQQCRNSTIRGKKFHYTRTIRGLYAACRERPKLRLTNASAQVACPTHSFYNDFAACDTQNHSFCNETAACDSPNHILYNDLTAWDSPNHNFYNDFTAFSQPEARQTTIVTAILQFEVLLTIFLR